MKSFWVCEPSFALSYLGLFEFWIQLYWMSYRTEQHLIQLLEDALIFWLAEQIQHFVLVSSFSLRLLKFEIHCKIQAQVFSIIKKIVTKVFICANRLSVDPNIPCFPHVFFFIWDWISWEVYCPGPGTLVFPISSGIRTSLDANGTLFHPRPFV